MAKLDLDRGVEIRCLPDGRQVGQYTDDPGVFLFMDGTPAEDALARQAGYAVDELKLERRKRAAVEAARARVEEEFGRQKDAYTALAEAAAEENLALAPAGKGRYRIVRTSNKAAVVDAMFSEDEARAMVHAAGGVLEGDEQKSPIDD